MQRRTFLQSALATGGIAAMPALTMADSDKPHPGLAYFELRAYQLKPGKQQVLDDYLRKALIPFLNRLGIQPVGAFHEIPVPGAAAPSAETTFLLIPQTMDQMNDATFRLKTDPEYLKAAAEYLAIPATDPVYDRIESSLLHAFETMPRLEPPEKRGRLFNLRVYESHNEAASAKKIEMFNKGEIAIFRRVGLTPVMFGEAVLGTRLPNLTYLLAFDDEAARTEAWNKFRADPEWIKLKAIPEYEDKRIVSKITNKLLKPTDYSQI